MEKRIICCFAVSLMIFVFSPAHALQMTIQTGFDVPCTPDIPNCDFRIIDQPNPSDFTLCMNACGRDPSCVAWTFDPVHTPGKLKCFLKNTRLPLRSSAATLVSGFKLPFTMGAFERDIDRNGCDIEFFEEHDIGQCVNACGFNSSCEAWNFDPAHFDKPVCFLKNCGGGRIPDPQSEPGVTGGVKFHTGAE